MDFGKRLKQLRDLQGLSVYELAKRAEMSHSIILYIENGQRPSPGLKTLRALAKGLGTSVGFLVGDEMKATTVA